MIVILILGASGLALLAVAFDDRELGWFPGVPYRTVRVAAASFGFVLALPLLPLFLAVGHWLAGMMERILK